MLRRNGPVVKSVESVLRLEGSLWWERFVKEVDNCYWRRCTSLDNSVAKQRHRLSRRSLRGQCVGVHIRKLEDSDANVIFDRFEYSTKSATRTSRAVQQASRRHKLTPSTPLPAQTTALTITENKQQIISTICEQFQEKGKTHNRPAKHSLLVNGPSSVPVEICKGIVIERKDKVDPRGGRRNHP